MDYLGVILVTSQNSLGGLCSFPPFSRAVGDNGIVPPSAMPRPKVAHRVRVLPSPLTPPPHPTPQQVLGDLAKAGLRACAEGKESVAAGELAGKLLRWLDGIQDAVALDQQDLL